MGTIEHMVRTLKQNRALRSKPNNNIFTHKSNSELGNLKFSSDKLKELSKENKRIIKRKINKRRQKQLIKSFFILIFSIFIVGVIVFFIYKLFNVDSFRLLPESQFK